MTSTIIRTRQIPFLFILSWLVIFQVFFGNEYIFGQEIQLLKKAETEIARDFIDLKAAPDDSARNSINARILSRFHLALMMPSAANYSFDSLKTIVRITSDDNRFTIFHWNLQRQNGQHCYYGFLRMNDYDKSKVFSLNDYSDSLEVPDILTLNPAQWYGALYYKVITGKTSQGTTFYTLLGWSGEDALVTSKVIEILSFNISDEPQFGLPVFKNYPGGMKTRIIFRFSSSVTMSLKFEEQIVSSKKKWNPRKRVFDITNTLEPIIVADRLIPMEPMLEGQYQYYVPAGDINDGFYMEDGNWMFIQGIESRNKPR